MPGCRRGGPLPGPIQSGVPLAKRTLAATIAIIALILLSPASLADGRQSWLQVASPHARVLFSDPRLEQHAQRVAAGAEQALAELGRLFSVAEPMVTITLDGDSDSFAAIAPPLPRPRVALPALFPAHGEVDLGSGDPLQQLLLHELTHVVALAYTERPPEVAPLPRLGLVGEAIAPVPPGWLLEGLAVWVAAGGSRGAYALDARSRGVIEALAVEGEWPSLEDVSLLSHAQWPAGEARYVLGGAFVDFLVEAYEWETLLAVLREVNAGWYLRPFEEAWRRVTGDDLSLLWREWGHEVQATALRRLAESDDGEWRPWTERGRASTVLALDPAGERLAWRPADGGLVVARIDEGGPAAAKAILGGGRRPLALAWIGSETLVYTRLVPAAGHRFIDLFQIDLSNGRETRLTRNERVRFPRADPGGCLLYVRDVVGEGSALKRLCPGGETELVFLAPEGSHIVGLAVSAGGRVALSLWHDGFVDLALYLDGTLDWLTHDGHQDLDPAWLGEEELIFRSDRGDVFDLYGLSLEDGRLRRMSSTLGGAFTPSQASGMVAFARLGGQGFDLAALPAERQLATLPLPIVPLSGAAGRADDQQPRQANESADYPVTPYNPLPSLAPFGWLPSVELVSPAPELPAVSATLLGQDDSGDHSYSLSGGYHPRISGPMGPLWLSARYDFRAIDAFDLFQRPPPLGFGVRAGVWPRRAHLSARYEAATGVLASVHWRSWLGDWSSQARAQAGVLSLAPQRELRPDARLDLVASRRYVDLWGYGIRGARLSAHALWSASPEGGSPAAWLRASTVLPPSAQAPFTAALELSAGYRQPPPVPVRLAPWALTVSLAARESVPVRWRYADGLVALERLTIEAGADGWYDGELGVGAHASLWGDIMLRYGAPISLGGTVGFSRGWWYRLGVRLPL